MDVPEATFHSCTVLSSDADAREVPSGENETARTQFVWPWRTLEVPEATFHSRTVLSEDADAREVPSGENETA